MEFIFNKDELSIGFIETLIYSFQQKNCGNYPSRIIIGHDYFYELENQFRKLTLFQIRPSYTINGIKIIRKSDIENNIIELY